MFTSSMFASSHTGNVRILEVNPDGNYVRVFNTSSFKVSLLVTFKELIFPINKITYNMKETSK